MKRAAFGLILLLFLLFPATPAHPGWTEEWCQPSNCVRIDTDPHIFIYYGGQGYHHGAWVDSNDIHGLQLIGGMDGSAPDQRVVNFLLPPSPVPPTSRTPCGPNGLVQLGVVPIPAGATTYYVDVRETVGWPLRLLDVWVYEEWNNVPSLQRGDQGLLFYDPCVDVGPWSADRLVL